MASQNIRIYELCRHGTRVLGPGLRYVIWTQGCLAHCPGCASPKSRPLDGGDLIPIQALANDIISRPEIEGITLSGGDPMLQADGLSELIRQVKLKRPELTVVCFTGYLLEKLEEQGQKELLSMIDLLIDGPYIDELNDGVGLRGSSNQRLHFLSDRLEPYHEQLEYGPRQIEVHIQDGKTVAYGMPKKDSFGINNN